MNKRFTLLILVVVLAAMGLVFFSQMQQTDPGQLALQTGTRSPGVDRDGRVIPKGPKQSETGLPAIDPPLGGSIVGVDGAPKPVNLTTGQEPVSPPSRTNATAKSAEPESPVPAKNATASKPPTEKAGGAPGLEPWAVPPKKEGETAKVTADATPKSPPKDEAKPKSEEKKAEAKPKSEEKKAEAKPKAATSSEPGVRNLTRIKLTPKGQSMHLRIEADGGFSCKTFVLTGPDRLVIDLPGKWKGVKAPAVPSNQLVKSARVGDQPAGPRVVLDLNRPIKGHQVQRLDNAIEVVLQ